MGRGTGLIGLVIVVGVVGYLYVQNIQQVTPVSKAPATTVDVTAVRMDLLAIANAERRYWALNSKYASLEELAANGDTAIPGRGRNNFTYSAQTSDSGFRIVATYTGSDSNAPRSMSVDETMSVRMD